MRSVYQLLTSLFIVFLTVNCSSQTNQQAGTKGRLLQNVTLIDGSGQPPQSSMNVLIQADTIADIAPANIKKNYVSNPEVIDMEGQTMMPLMVNAHGHVGLLKGTSISPDKYTHANIKRQLKQYQNFGIGAVLSLGSDRNIIFEIRDSSRAGNIPGARLLTAGFGFGAPDGVPPVNGGFDKVYRPATVDQAQKQVQELAKQQPDFIKIWVDDGMGSVQKIKPEIYKTIITEAQNHDIPVAAHEYYLSDAKELIRSGVSVLAHSIRDQKVDRELLQLMKENNVVYIPTLTRDYFLFAYAQDPEWLDDSFFRAALEPGVYDMLTSNDYVNNIKNDPNLQQKKEGYQMALKNLKKIYDAGIRIALGTDSGAQPVRALGFSEHLELKLMHEAGIPVQDIIKIATQNAAETLGISQNFGMLSIGKPANFLILNNNPVDSLRNTRDIAQVWREGTIVHEGIPAAKN